ncbi:neuronal acetylcholine receptor subunit alpha-7-like [Aplysia californica]|uniref:Neuronal acetylcholine receptor subunit alpha-7-like n=1 Tax=Aplysia californica TaxID=6500 RepID=A0ABM0ZWI0_APLCA|nr:neuronal acetylcholine receptor subunit alpha-7-like [Aplysia californica]
MIRNRLLLILSFLTAFVLAQGALVSDMHNLFTNVILASDHRYLPLINQTDRVLVNISISLLFIYDVNEVQQTMSACFMYDITWTDELRQWRPEDYGGISDVQPDPLDIWKPRLLAANSIGSQDFIGDTYAPLHLYSNGHVTWLPGGIVHFSCSMILTYFPFDTQQCHFAILGGEIASHVTYSMGLASISAGRHAKNGEWDILEIRGASLISHTTGLPLVTCSISLRRRPQFIVLNIIMPVNLLSCISVFVFWVPVESGERLSLSITTLLSLTVYMSEIYSDLPKTSDHMPLLVIYLMCLLVHSILVLISNIILLTVYHHGRDNNEKSKTNCQSKDNESQIVTESNQNTYTSQLMEHSHKMYNSSVSPRSGFHSRDTVKGKVSQKGTTMTKLLDIMWGKLACRFPESENKGQTALTRVLSRVLTYIGLADLILFILFSVMWLIIFAVFTVVINQGTN